MENYDFSQELCYRHEPSFDDMDLLYNIDFIDAEGNKTIGSGRSGSGSSRGRDGVRTITRHIDWDSCSGIEFVRYTINMHPVIRLVPLTLENIPVLDD